MVVQMIKRRLKYEHYLELILLAYQLANDDKSKRIYFFNRAKSVFIENELGHYIDNLVLDFNLLHDDVKTDVERPNITQEEKTRFNAKLHDILIDSYCQ